MNKSLNETYGLVFRAKRKNGVPHGGIVVCTLCERGFNLPDKPVASVERVPTHDCDPENRHAHRFGEVAY